MGQPRYRPQLRAGAAQLPDKTLRIRKELPDFIGQRKSQFIEIARLPNALEQISVVAPALALLAHGGQRCRHLRRIGDRYRRGSAGQRASRSGSRGAAAGISGRALRQRLRSTHRLLTCRSAKGGRTTHAAQQFGMPALDVGLDLDGLTGGVDPRVDYRHGRRIVLAGFIDGDGKA